MRSHHMPRQPIAYSNTERRILALLKDGKSHPREKVLECLMDSQANYDNLRWHIHMLRKKVKTSGFEIVCESRPGDDGTMFSYRMERKYKRSDPNYQE